MFGKIFNIALIASTLVAGVVAKSPSVSRITSHKGKDISFNTWGGHHSLAGFDNFYGVDNFVGLPSHYEFVKQDKEPRCHSQGVRTVQQRLLVIQELAKRIITEKICDVETQMIVYQQFLGSTGLFSDDIRRLSGRPVGYDSKIVGHFKDIIGTNGSLSTTDFGFSGHDLGMNTVVVCGANWNDFTSPATVGFAYYASLYASFDE